MAERILNLRMQMKHDTPQNWKIHNPILNEGEIGVAIDSNTGVCTMKVGDGVHHWNDLTLLTGEKIVTENYISARGGPSNREIGRLYSHAEGVQSYAAGYCSYAEGQMSQAMHAMQQAASAFGVTAEQAADAIRTLSASLSNANNLDTVSEVQTYLANQNIKTTEMREKSAQSQSKDFRSSLKTLTDNFDDYNLIEVGSDITFDF